jgi:hypothetical protein
MKSITRLSLALMMIWIIKAAGAASTSLLS